MNIQVNIISIILLTISPFLMWHFYNQMKMVESGGKSTSINHSMFGIFTLILIIDLTYLLHSIH
jgi:hypothetical protein